MLLVHFYVASSVAAQIKDFRLPRHLTKLQGAHTITRRERRDAGAFEKDVQPGAWLHVVGGALKPTDNYGESSCNAFGVHSELKLK
jgi:hypothetical protein